MSASHRVDDLGDQGHGGDQAGVAAGLGALGHHDVAPGVEGPPGVVHLAAHVDHQDAVAVAELDHLGRAPPGRPRTPRRPPSMTCSTWPTRSPGMAVSRSTPNGLSVAARTCGDLGHHPLVAHGRGAEAAETPGLGDGGDQRGVRDAAHAGQHHRVLDTEDLGQSRLHVGLLCRSPAPRRRAPFPCTRRPAPAAPYWGPERVGQAT